MTRILKRTGAVVAGVLALALLAVVVFAWRFDPNAYKPRIESFLERETGREVTLAGDISLAFFPRPALRTGRIVIANPPAFGPGVFAALDALELRAKPLPLLAGALALDPVIIEGLRVRLVRSASGESNVDDLPARFAPAGDTAPAGALALGGLRIDGAVVTLDDRQTDRRIRIGDIALTAGAWSGERPVAVWSRFDVEGMSVEVDGEVSLEAPARRILIPSLTIRARPPAMEHLVLTGGGIRLDLAGQRLDWSELKVRGALSGGIPFRLDAPGGAADLAAGTASLERITAGALDLRASGALTASGLPGNPALSGRVRLSPFSPRALLERLGHPLPAGVMTGRLGQARLATLFSAKRGGIRFHAIDAAVDAARLSGEVRLDFGETLPVDIDLVLALPAGGAMPPELVELKLRGRGTYAPAAGAFVADNFEAALGPATARGTLDIAAGSGGLRYTVTFDVPAFNPRALLAHLELPAPETRDPQALEKVALNATLSGSGDQMTMDPLTLSVDETRLRGRLEFSGIAGGVPAAGFTLRADAIDADRYLPPAGQPGAPVAAFAPGLELPALKSWRLDGRLAIGALTSGGVTFDNVEIKSVSGGGGAAARGVAGL